MEFIDIDFTKENDLKTMIDKINQNHTFSRAIIKEINKLEQENKETKDKIEEDKNKNLITENTEQNIQYFDEEFENEVEYYFSQLDSLSDLENIKENSSNILPSSKKPNFKKIILRLKLELIKNIKAINELINEERKNISKEDLEDFKYEILLEKTKIKILDNKLSNVENNIITEEVEDNNLIFIPTISGNIRVLEELEKIDQEYLEGFKVLFNSIKDGTLKNVKRFVNNKTLNVSEVKGDKIRVIFDRIGKNDYAIITAIIKKCGNDRGYVSPIEGKIKNYENQKDNIKKCLENDDFREQNKKYEIELFNILNNVDSNSKIKRREK